MKVLILIVLSVVLCPYPRAAAQDNRKFCHKFQRNVNLGECLEKQQDSYYDLHSGLYDNKIIDKCTARYVYTDRVVTYIDYYRSYRCAKKEQTIYDQLHRRSLTMKSAFLTN